MRPIAALLVTLTVLTTASAQETAMSQPFGKTKDGTPVELFTLKNASGIVAKVMTRGATLVELHVPDKDGNVVDVINGFDDVRR